MILPLEIFQTIVALVGCGTGCAALWIVLGDRRRAWQRRRIVTRVLAR
jgi:threonine/homoserine/homoserine lactone efflux protein